MGCVSSKLIKKEVEREILCGANGEYIYIGNHLVSLTSTTYGALKLESPSKPQEEEKEEESEFEEETEVINAWELMGDLEEGPVRGKNSIENKGRSPFKRLIKLDSAEKVNKSTMGKENRGNSNSKVGVKERYLTPQRMSKSSSSSSRKSLSPLFDPALVEAYEKELYLEEEQGGGEIKKIISQTTTPSRMRCGLNFDFENKCPSGGEDRVVIYTTTLRGIRKTFEECNIVRSILESHHIRIYERDLSMDSGFKEELRKLMGPNKFRIPLVFVKGRFIGGALEISNLEEQGQLSTLLHQIPRNSARVCQACAGIRFILCPVCNGSCKVLDDHHKKNTTRCGECNENGLIHCPLCS